MNPISTTLITIGEAVVRYIERLGTKAAFGVISIHNMPILDAIHRLKGDLQFVSTRGEAGAANSADAYARVTGQLGVCITSTGTGCGNAAGALIEARTAGTPLLHLTGQIESDYLDRDWGFIHEFTPQLHLLQTVSKAAFRLDQPDQCWSILQQACQIAQTAPCGPVSIEIPIDVQKHLIPCPTEADWLAILPPTPTPTPHPQQHSNSQIETMINGLKQAKRPMLWVGGGAKTAGQAIQRFLNMGWMVVSSVQGRGIVPEDHPMSLGSYHLQPATEALYTHLDACLVVGSHLRSNETLTYQLKLPKPLYRIDIDPLAEHRGYPSTCFVQGDANVLLHALADGLEGQMTLDPTLAESVASTRLKVRAGLNHALGPYAAFKDAVAQQWGHPATTPLTWVRDITLSNTSWGNREPVLHQPRQGVHAVGGGIGQSVAMGIGAAVAARRHGLSRKTVVLCGDGGLMLNCGELACAVQEKLDLVILLMNDRRYGVIRNIQDDIYGSRHCYVDLHNPDFSMLCESLGIHYRFMDDVVHAPAVLAEADTLSGVVMVEVDMNRIGDFHAKFAGPPKKT